MACLVQSSSSQEFGFPLGNRMSQDSFNLLPTSESNADLGGDFIHLPSENLLRTRHSLRLNSQSSIILPYDAADAQREESEASTDEDDGGTTPSLDSKSTRNQTAANFCIRNNKPITNEEDDQHWNPNACQRTPTLVRPATPEQGYSYRSSGDQETSAVQPGSLGLESRKRSPIPAPVSPSKRARRTATHNVVSDHTRRENIEDALALGCNADVARGASKKHSRATRSGAVLEVSDDFAKKPGECERKASNRRSSVRQSQGDRNTTAKKASSNAQKMEEFTLYDEAQGRFVLNEPTQRDYADWVNYGKRDLRRYTWQMEGNLLVVTTTKHANTRYPVKRLRNNQALYDTIDRPDKQKIAVVRVGWEMTGRNLKIFEDLDADEKDYVVLKILRHHYQKSVKQKLDTQDEVATTYPAEDVSQTQQPPPITTGEQHFQTNSLDMYSFPMNHMHLLNQTQQGTLQIPAESQAPCSFAPRPFLNQFGQDATIPASTNVNVTDATVPASTSLTHAAVPTSASVTQAASTFYTQLSSQLQPHRGQSDFRDLIGTQPQSVQLEVYQYLKELFGHSQNPIP